MRKARELAAEERADFAEFLAALSPEQWRSSTLCDEWTVRDVVAHTITYLGQSTLGLTMNMLRSAGNIDRLNARILHHLNDSGPERLTDLMRQDTTPTGAAALYGGRVALIECVIHRQDIRRALNLPRSVDPDRIRACLKYARVSPVIGGARRTRNLQLVATDMTWSAGHGHPVHGSGEALLLAMTGRASAVEKELTGDGVALLVTR